MKQPPRWLSDLTIANKDGSPLSSWEIVFVWAMAVLTVVLTPLLAYMVPEIMRFIYSWFEFGGQEHNLPLRIMLLSFIAGSALTAANLKRWNPRLFGVAEITVGLVLAWHGLAAFSEFQPLTNMLAAGALAVLVSQGIENVRTSKTQ